MEGDKEVTHAEYSSSLYQFPKRRKGGKHVSFPSDEELVSCFAEHRNALGNETIALMEVVSAYMQSCEKHRVEPKSKILEQLQARFRENVPQAQQEASSKCSKAGGLELQGERLDNRSCESLEDILKLLQFDFINLRDTELEENGASSLLDMILFYESASHLDMSSNTRIGISGWKALAHLIQQSSRLWRLDVCNMPILEYPAQALSKALLTSRLTVLCLKNACLSGKPLFTLVGTLRVNTALQEICLANNKLNSFQDSMQLGDLLKYNRGLLSLDLSNNLISDPGLEEICEGLKAQGSRLRHLVLWDNHITHHGMLHLAKALPLATTLETLNLGCNNLQNKGIQILKEPLIANRSIQQLGLASTRISCEGAVVLAEFIAESLLIKWLDIQENPIQTGGLMALSLVLKINRSLIRLDLDSKEEKDEFLIETQKNVLQAISERCVWNVEHPSSLGPASRHLYVGVAPF